MLSVLSSPCTLLDHAQATIDRFAFVANRPEDRPELSTEDEKALVFGVTRARFAW